MKYCSSFSVHPSIHVLLKTMYKFLQALLPLFFFFKMHNVIICQAPFFPYEFIVKLEKDTTEDTSSQKKCRFYSYDYRPEIFKGEDRFFCWTCVLRAYIRACMFIGSAFVLLNSNRDQSFNQNYSKRFRGHFLAPTKLCNLHNNQVLEHVLGMYH